MRIALPLIAAYMAELLMFLTTKIVVGKLGFVELAAVGLAGHLTFEILIILMGMLSVVGVLIARAIGAGDPAKAGIAVRQGILVAILLALPSSVFVWHLAAMLAYTAQAPEVLAFVDTYCKAVAGCVLPVLCFSVLRSFAAARSRALPVMAITFVAVVLNYVLTVGLVHGRFAMPAMGVAGAGVATTVVSWAMLIALLGYMYNDVALRGFGVFASRLSVVVPVCRDIVTLGFPVAGLVVLESGLFAAVAVLSGVLGPHTLAACEILMGWIGVPFVVALGLAEATMMRVSHGIGQHDARAARRAGILGMVATTIVVAALIVVPLKLPHLIVGVFLDDLDPGFTAVSNLVGQLLVIVAIFQIFDGLQAVAARALRALKDTMAPLWIAGMGYWVVGIGGGCYLAFALELGAQGLWWGLAAGLIITGSVLAWRFLHLVAISTKAAKKGAP